MALACTKSEFTTNGTCWTGQFFSNHGQNALIVYRLAQIVDSLAGSATYAVAPFTALWSAANDATCGLTPDQLKAAYIGILNTQPPASISNSLTSPPAALTKGTAETAITCLVNYSDDQLHRMYVFLNCYMFGLLGW